MLTPIKIALLTTFFLPGTSFAVRLELDNPQSRLVTDLDMQAVLAMPFFATNKYLSNITKFWVWVALTIPSTSLSFLFYIRWNMKESKRKRAAISEEEMTNLNGSPP